MRRRHFAGWLAGALLARPLLATAQSPTPEPQLPAAPAPQPVDLELVLLVDASASITTGALDFQLRGHAAAFRDDKVKAAIAAGPGIAVTVARFDGPRTLKVLLPWRRLASAADADAFADAVLAAPAGQETGSTAIGSAVLDALELFKGSGFDGPRRTIDIVSNGFSNAGVDPSLARDTAEAADVTVNALVILDEYDWLEGYYRQQVIGGIGAFVRTAEGRDSFIQALIAKLIDEIV
ncbi:DUF1194 domain-containing protein [Inquilinus sp. CA228]|uniref:DUF1194 domain-containing protein n=1 Tax=Inquilinus sp. CA228 TaxID=3455609 RepID=UPI003F8D106B